MPPVNSAAGIIRKLTQYNDVLIALAVVFIIVIIIIPIPPVLLDLLLSVSITFSLVVLLLTLYTTRTLDFSVFPSLLLVATLFRLSLNISSTRLILGEATAGDIINAFGDFVVGGNYVVGLVVFIIITVIQFVVITNGAGRVAEVAARFTLDAMPGKQMSIDADFNAGLIDEDEARTRRDTLQREANFYGAMDGASKFVKGDAIAGVVIMLVNIIGGLAIGVLQHNMEIQEAIETYTLLTVGDGLVTQIPALLVATSSGMLVTRSSSEGSFGEDLTSQLFRVPRVIGLAGGILLALGLVPGLPFIPFFILAVASGLAAYLLSAEEKQKGLQEEEAAMAKEEEPTDSKSDDFMSLIPVDLLEVELGYNLISLTDADENGDLLERVTATRRQTAMELGLPLQPIRVRDNLQLSPNSYNIKLKGNVIGEGELYPNKSMAMNPGGEIEEELPGISTIEPTFGLPATWIDEEHREQAELSGYTVVDATTVIITHLTELVRAHAHELLGRQEVKSLTDMVKETRPALVEELIPDILSLGDVQKVMQNMLKEKIPIRDVVSILETLSDSARVGKNIDFLTESARQSINRTICSMYTAEDNKLYVLTLDPQLEQKIADSLQDSPQGAYPVLNPQVSQKIFSVLAEKNEEMSLQGKQPVLLVSPRIRLPFRRLTERVLPNMVVLSFNEVVPGLDVDVIGMVSTE